MKIEYNERDVNVEYVCEYCNKQFTIECIKLETLLTCGYQFECPHCDNTQYPSIDILEEMHLDEIGGLEEDVKEFRIEKEEVLNELAKLDNDDVDNINMDWLESRIDLEALDCDILQSLEEIGKLRKGLKEIRIEKKRRFKASKKD